MSIRPESRTPFAEMTEVIVTEACLRLPFGTSVAPTERTSDSREQLNSVRRAEASKGWLSRSL